jgi:hypothetical protein
VVDFLLLAAETEVKAGAYQWFAFSIIVSLGLFPWLVHLLAPVF